MNPTYDFKGQVALVTGASSGMGLATARAFAEQGASIALADINQDTLCAATYGAFLERNRSPMGAPKNRSEKPFRNRWQPAATGEFTQKDA
jgi:NAD(P)-dependent dehydrogenase (short-subunit alcohol dehydrogenase family)